MLRTMALQRAIEDRMVSTHRRGELLGSPYAGHRHEAIAVGTAAALRHNDLLCPSHRDLGAHLWRGMDPAQVMASFLGRATGPAGGRDGTLNYGRLDLNIYNPPSHIPDNYPVATGGAFAFKYRGEDRVAIAYCGDGSTPRGDFHEALNIAAVLDLPCIFVVENNQFAYPTPLRLRSGTDFASKAAAYGIAGEMVDGIDVVAVYEATKRAAERARAGDGPTLIEAVTMRLHGHAEHDPVEEFAKKLTKLGYATRAELNEIKEDARRQAVEAQGTVLAAALPVPDDEEARVYAAR
jgi:TPP-dependent pyruvate/acetoin dehydrogenase alpha subunit